MATDLTLDQGSDKRWTITVRVNDVLKDLTGSSFAGMARENFDDENPAFEFDFTIKTPATDGIVYMDISNEDSAAIELGADKSKKFFYDVEWTDAEGKKKKILTGKMTVNAEVTK
jgi:hypothetical protein